MTVVSGFRYVLFALRGNEEIRVGANDREVIMRIAASFLPHEDSITGGYATPLRLENAAGDIVFDGEMILATLRQSLLRS